jgi:hypothetical protein
MRARSSSRYILIQYSILYYFVVSISSAESIYTNVPKVVDPVSVQTVKLVIIVGGP